MVSVIDRFMALGAYKPVGKDGTGILNGMSHASVLLLTFNTVLIRAKQHNKHRVDASHFLLIYFFYNQKSKFLCKNCGVK